MKKIILLAIMFFSFYAVSSALNPIKVSTLNGGAVNVQVDVELIDLDNPTPPVYTEDMGLQSANSSGYISFIVGGGSTAWANIDPANVDGKWVLNVLIAGTLHSQYRLDNIMFNQAQSNFLELDSDGNIVMEDLATPVDDNDAATKKYVDDAVAGVSGGGGGCNIYGDGSAGDVTISANTDWSTTPPTNGNYMFNNLTINSGITLTVASGTVIQVAGTFTNNGTVNVKTGVLGRAWFGNADGGNADALGNTLTERRAYPSEVLRRITKLGPKGGSGGSIGSGSSVNTFGGNGGGTLSIFASSGLSNAGTINAQGQDSPALPGGSTRPGVGGGGGGYLLLASNGNISNTGTVDVSGGAGCDAGDASGDRGGSGGGGGLIHYISPNANAVAGTNTIAGGAVGVSDGTGESGGSGGAGAGDGGYGGSFPSIAPNPGSSGVLLRTQVNDACAFINN